MQPHPAAPGLLGGAPRRFFVAGRFPRRRRPLVELEEEPPHRRRILFVRVVARPSITSRRASGIRRSNSAPNVAGEYA